MKSKERLKHALFATMAIPVGAICAMLFGAILLVVATLLLASHQLRFS